MRVRPAAGHSFGPARHSHTSCTAMWGLRDYTVQRICSRLENCQPLQTVTVVSRYRLDLPPRGGSSILGHGAYAPGGRNQGAPATERLAGYRRVGTIARMRIRQLRWWSISAENAHERDSISLRIDRP